jgi:hypothetical protein
VRNPYESRRPSSEVVVEHLAKLALDEKLLTKAFVDL